MVLQSKKLRKFDQMSVAVYIYFSRWGHDRQVRIQPRKADFAFTVQPNSTGLSCKVGRASGKLRWSNVGLPVARIRLAAHIDSKKKRCWRIF